MTPSCDRLSGLCQLIPWGGRRRSGFEGPERGVAFVSNPVGALDDAQPGGGHVLRVAMVWRLRWPQEPSGRLWPSRPRWLARA